MTVTAEAPAAAPATTEPPAQAAPLPGLAAVLGSADHKVVGRVWIVAALIHLALGGVASVAVAAERIDSASFDILGGDWFTQIATYRSIGLAFLFLLPFTIGIATSVVPLQVGAPTLAFPRAAAAAAWTYLFGGALVIASYGIDGGLGGSDTDGVRLFVASFVLVLVALTVAWIAVVTTVIALRPRGLRLNRAPLFAWSTVVAGGVWIVTLPVLAGLAVLSYLDVRYGTPLGGDSTAIYARIAWVFSTPAVYAFAIPALGVIGSVVPVFLQTRHQQHRVAQGLIGAFGALSIGAWTMPRFGDLGRPWLYEGPWIVVSFAILVPVLGLVGLWALTAQRGKPVVGSPLLFAVASLLVLLLGLAAGAVQAIKPIETIVDGDGTPLWGTAWSTGVSSLVLLAAGIALFGALVYWAPKILGRTLADTPVKGLVPLFLLGALVWGVPQLVAGLFGQPGDPGLRAGDNVDLLETLSLVSTVGAALLALAVIGLVGLIAKSLAGDDAAADDPWNGHTLEWATTSPPPPGNFTELPAITSEAPLYDARRPSEEVSA
ncbi:MAG: cbb3-type cytochrome c oxidase subunit I [Actinomycetota bacterium]|nr:cbb3-type cytochrome c oxidase subunit I [Actinomycetota bacterium]